MLLLDIESGSAGSALMYTQDDAQPKLFGEFRAYTPVRLARSGTELERAAEEAALKAIQNAAEVAARVRTHAAAAPLGQVDAIAIFLAPPWATPNLEAGTPAFLESMVGKLRRGLERTFGRTPVSLYTSAGKGAFAVRSLMGGEPCLVCSVTGEATELMHLDDTGVAAHATLPWGLHGFIRTLRTHAGLSEAEARSAMQLPHSHHEAGEAAAQEFAAHIKSALQDMIRGTPPRTLIVLAHEPSVERIARALAESETLSELFPSGGAVRALRSHLAAQHIAAHAEAPDVRLMLAALFVDSNSLQNL